MNFLIRRKKSAPIETETPKYERKNSLQEMKTEHFNCRSVVNIKAKCFTNLVENEKVTVVGIQKDLCIIKDRGFVPKSSLNINIHCYNVYIDLLSILKEDINILKYVAINYTKELANLMRCDNDIQTILTILFKDELYNNHEKGLDTESLRGETPVILLCKEFIKPIKLWFLKDHDLTQYECPKEISNIIYSLYNSINKENCNISDLELTSSFFCLRVLCPLLIDDIPYIKNLMKNINIVHPLIKKIIEKNITVKEPEYCCLKDGEKIYNYLISQNIKYFIDVDRINKLKEILFYSAIDF